MMISNHGSTDIEGCACGRGTFMHAVTHTPAFLRNRVLVDGTVHTAGNQNAVVLRPGECLHLRVVSAQIAHDLARVGLVDLNRVRVHRREVLPAMRKFHLSFFVRTSQKMISVIEIKN